MSFSIKHSLFYVFFCLSSVVLLTFCSDSNNNSAQNDPNAGTTPDPTPSPTTTQDTTTNEPNYRLTPSEITAGLPFSFEMTSDNPYLLSLNNCGADTLLLQGTWPDAKSATTHIEGQDGVKLNNLAIVDTSGSPTITTDCQLKATVNRGKAGEKSTLMPLTIKAGTITLSNAKMLARNVELEARGMPDNLVFFERPVVVVGKKETSAANGETTYRFVALSNPINELVKNNKVTSDVKLYVPPRQAIYSYQRNIRGF